MDEVQGHEPDKPCFVVEPTKPGFSLEESRRGLSSGLYLDESLENGLGSGDTSSVLYYGLNCDGGGLYSSAFREGEDVFKDRNSDKMPSEDGAVVDLFSASGLSNAYTDFFWDFDFSKKFPDLDYQFCEESDSWNSSLVSQSSGSSCKAVGVSELSSQILECQNNQHEKLITCELDGSYMTSFAGDMLMNDEMGVNSSYSNNLPYNSDVKNIASPVDTSESCHCTNEGYFGTFHDLNYMKSSGTSFPLSMQCYDASLVDEGMEAGNPSLQAGSFNKPAYSCDLQHFSQVSPVDTSESYNHSTEGHFGTSHGLNHLGAGYTTLCVQCNDASLVDENSKADDPSLLGVLINNPAFSWVSQDFTEVSPMDTTESFPCSNEGYNGTSHDFKHSDEGYIGASHDLKHLSPSCTSLAMQVSASLVEEDTEADDPSPPVCSCDPQDIGEVKNYASPLETSESYHRSDQGYFGTALELNHLGPLGSSLSMQCSDASLEDEDTEADHLTLQGASVNRASDPCDLHDIGQVNIVAGPMETNKFYHRRKKGYCGSSDDPNPLGASFTSMFMQFSDANLVDEETEADDPSLQGLLISKPADLCDPLDIGELNSVASPVGTGESHQYENEGCVATSNNLDLIPQALSRDSIFVQGSDASPMVEDSEEDDPTLQSILIDERAKCRKVGQRLCWKEVQKPIMRCSNGSPTLKSRCERRTKEESTNSAKRKHVEAKSQNKRHRKRIKDTALVAHNAVTRTSGKQDLDSDDDEYDPCQSNLKIRRSKKGSNVRKNNKLWTLSESKLKIRRSKKESDGSKNNKLCTLSESNSKIRRFKKGSDGRKNSNLWTLSEVIKLVDGISEFGVGKWTPIQRSLFRSPPYRTSLDIRDKWRNLIKTSAVRLKSMKEEEFSQKNGSIKMSKSLLERICELDRAEPYQRSDVKRRQNCGHDLLDSSSE